MGLTPARAPQTTVTDPPATLHRPARVEVEREPVERRAPAAGRGSGPGRRLPGWAGLLGLLCAYTALAVLLFLPAWRAPATRAVGSGGDVDQFIWYLRWTPHALSHGWSPFVTHALNLPDGVNLLWETSVVVPAILLWPVTALFGPVVSYNVLLTAGLAVSALAGAALLRELRRSWAASAVGGLLYGFSPYVAAQSLGHANLTFVALPPLVGIVLVRLLEGRMRPLRAGLAAGVLVALQLLVSEEVLASTALAAAVLLASAAAVRRPQARALVGPVARATGFVALVGGVLAAVPLAVQFLGPDRVHGQLNSRTSYVADLAGLVLPTRNQALAPSALSGATDRFTGDPSEWGAYIGLPLLALVAWYTWRRRADLRLRIAGLFTAVMALLSLGPLVHVLGRQTVVPTPMAVVDALPVLSNMLADRLSVFVFLGIAVIVGHFLDDAGAVRGAALRAGVALVALGVLVPRLPMPTSGQTVPAFFTTAADLDLLPPGAVVAVAPYAGPDDARAMLWQAQADMRFSMPGGYVIVDGPDGRPTAGGRPTALGRVLEALARGADPRRLPPAAATEVRGELRSLGVDAVLVGPMAHEREAVAWLTGLLGRPPQTVGGVALWRDLR